MTEKNSNIVSYKVGPHLFKLSLPQGVEADDFLPSFAPFRQKDEKEDGFIFSLSVSLVENASLVGEESSTSRIAEFDLDVHTVKVFVNSSGEYVFRINGTSAAGSLTINRDYSRGEIIISAYVSVARRIASGFVLAFYAFASVKHGTLVLHSSVIKKDGLGYAFLGKSGTGKSTHSRLWLSAVEGSSLLNDDTPVISLRDGTPRIYGTPWSGKTICYKNESARLRAIVRLSQAPANRIMCLDGLQAYAAIIPSCIYMRWDDAMSEAVSSVVERFIAEKDLRVMSLACLPNEDAAKLCYQSANK